MAFCKILLILLSSLFLFSCQGVELKGKTENVEGYSKAEAMVVIGSERNRYQTVFGPGIWDMPLNDKQEENYGEYFIGRMKEFLQDIKTLTMLSKERGIIITSAEMDKIRGVAAIFYEGLSEDDKAFMGCSIKDVTNMYQEYFLASKTARYLLNGFSAEISYADAKVIVLEQIVSESAEEALQYYQEVTQEGANFSYFARQASSGEAFEVKLSRRINAGDDVYYSVAFSLEEGQISEPFIYNDKYYILKCIEGYDEEGTMEMKGKLETAIRNAVFEDNFKTYSEQHIIRFRETFWKEIDLKLNPESTASNFFSLYDSMLR